MILFGVRPLSIVSLWLLLALGGLLISPVRGQSHGEVTRVDGETLYVELDDSISVDPGTTGRIVQERTVNGERVRMTFAVLSVDGVEQAVTAPWVVACQLTRQSRNLDVGDRVTFDAVTPRARLTVRTEPADAIVYVDGTRVGTTPLEGTLGRGDREVRLERDGYREVQRTLSVEPGGRYRVRDSLDLATGTLVVNSLPDGATAEVEGRTLGTTPTSTELREGPYTVQVRRDGYLPYEETVALEGGGETQVNATLRRPLQVSLSPDQVAEVANAELEREGDRLLFTYDLVGEDDTYAVDLLLSTDGGRTFEPLPETVAGAIGDEVAAGADKQIVWAAIEDFPKGVTGSGNQLRLSVKSDGGNGVYWVVGSVLTAGAGTAAAALLGMFDGGGDGGGDDLPNAPPGPPN